MNVIKNNRAHLNSTKILHKINLRKLYFKLISNSKVFKLREFSPLPMDQKMNEKC